MTKKKVQPAAAPGKGEAPALSWAKDISGRNPLTLEEVRELARDIAVRLEMEEGRGLLLILHALTYSMIMGDREHILQAVKEESAWLFPAFDTMVREEMRQHLAQLRAKGGAR
jgi:hypothetical protein